MRLLAIMFVVLMITNFLWAIVDSGNAAEADPKLGMNENICADQDNCPCPQTNKENRSDKKSSVVLSSEGEEKPEAVKPK